LTSYGNPCHKNRKLPFPNNLSECVYMHWECEQALGQRAHCRGWFIAEQCRCEVKSSSSSKWLYDARFGKCDDVKLQNAQLEINYKSKKKHAELMNNVWKTMCAFGQERKAITTKECCARAHDVGCKKPRCISPRHVV